MVVGICRFVIGLPGNGSLKDKRRRIRPIIAALQSQHKFSVAEVEFQDQPDRAAIAFALVSNDRRVVNSEIDKAMDRIELLSDVVLQEHDFEITNY
jgi:uncharacterized protein